MRPSVIVAVLLLAACHAYQPIEQMPNAPGAHLAATLTPDGAVRVASLIGPRAAEVHGRYLASTDTSVVLSMTSVILADGQTQYWTGERVELPRQAVERWAVERVARARTALLAGALVAASAIAHTSFGGSGAVGSGGKSSGGSQQ